MDIKVLTNDGDYDLLSVPAGTVLFLFPPDEWATALLILEALCEITTYQPTRVELERLIGLMGPSAAPVRTTVN